MVILGIETSCDETAAAVVKNGRKILSNIVASSIEMHIKTGGIIPENAAREQVKSIIPTIQEALTYAFPSFSLSTKPANLPIDAIAVTVGPGLIGSLLVGVETAKTLAYVFNKPIIPINHLVGHIYANWLNCSPPLFPAISLVVSGGHTDLVLIKNHNDIRWIGGTRDDAAGEAFDKTARLLGLGFPGGPAIDAAASQLKIKDYRQIVKLPRPLINDKSFDFSFSGLKTAVARELERLKSDNLLNQSIPYLAYEIQEAITDVLVDKTLKAVKKYKTPTILLAGGVAANKRLREKFKLEVRNLKLDIDLRVPPPHLCTDNAAMIAAAAEYNYKPLPWQDITANPSLTIEDKPA
jgi:N6-L-threonylcarbamoyladenine synthase